VKRDLRLAAGSARTVSVTELRHNFAKIEAWLKQGDDVVIRKRNRPVAKLVPLPDYPDFAARQRKIFANKVLPVSGAEIVAWDRSRGIG